MTMPRILLIEDDASIRRFVEFALEDIPAKLLVTDHVQGAIALLKEAPADLILTDLMLPGESGIDLLQYLAEHPILRRQARVVVFSAGLNPEVRAQLQDLGVWKMMSKPISVVDLLSCVEEAIGTTSAPPPEAAAAPMTHESARSLLSKDEQDAIREHFNDDIPFFLLYRQTCLLQFPKDIEKGDQAAAEQDLQALRRLGHSLKTVLLTLAQHQACQQAKTLETVANAGEPFAALEQWVALKQALQSIPPLPRFS